MKENKKINYKDVNKNLLTNLLAKINNLSNQLLISKQYEEKLKAENKSLNNKLIDMQSQIDNLLITEEKYNNIIKKISTIKLSAELFSTELIEESETQAMESINVVDDILKEIEIFKKDVETLKSDLNIGTLTMQDRIYNFSFSINSFSSNLINIKNKFYKQYNLLKEKI